MVKTQGAPEEKVLLKSTSFTSFPEPSVTIGAAATKIEVFPVGAVGVTLSQAISNHLATLSHAEPDVLFDVRPRPMRA